MSYIAYGQATVGGKKIVAVMGKLQEMAADLANLKAWIEQIGPSNLDDNADFLSPDGQALNDTFIQVADAYATFYGDGSSGTNAEKIARMARG